MLKQITGELRQQPLIATVTIAGTALAIFLIMTVVMLQEVKVAPIAPESNRDRFLHARFFHQEQIDNSGFGGSGTLSYKMAQRLYGNLPHTDTTACFNPGTTTVSASVHGKSPVQVDIRKTDAAYWRVFDFTFLHGSGFTGEDMEANLMKAVISAGTARAIFGTDDVVGRELYLDYFTPVTVTGVVRDVPTVTSLAYSQVWLPLSEEERNGWSEFMGPVHATILADSPADFPAIREEVNRRVEALNAELKSNGMKFKMADHGAPYPQEAIPELRYSNVTPDYKGAAVHRWLVYAILLIIPAINLSSITQSRLRRRVSEIGVRRAFGCTRFGIIRSILGENLIITLAGGMLGFILSVLFAWLAADTLFAGYGLTATDTGVTPMMLLNANVFILALGFCFVLNLITAFIPAWRAAHLNPVEAIGGLNK